MNTQKAPSDARAGITVVGGGFAALEVGLALRKLDASRPVHVVSDQTDVAYRPWLIRVPAGVGRAPTIPSARLLTAAGAKVVAGCATGVDLNARRLTLDSGSELVYDELVIASGARSDRDRVRGAAEHAIFPCELDETTRFAERIAAGATHVAIVFGWERPGPGLEFAGWIAAHRPGVRVTVIDGDGTMARRFGEKATAWIRGRFERQGAKLITDGALLEIADGVVRTDAADIEADVIAVVGPLRGNTEWLPAALLGKHGHVPVSAAMAASPGIFGIGDVVAVPDGYRLSPALRSIQATARGVAANVVASARGGVAAPVLQHGRPDLLGPDLAGSGILVRDGKLILRGRLPLLIRSAGERRYLRSRSASFV